MKFNSLLLTTDFSENSYHVFDYAVQAAKNNKTKIYLIAIVPDTSPIVYRDVIGQIDECAGWNKKALETAEANLKEVSSKYMSEIDIKCVALEEKEGIAKDIVDYAEQNKINGILISSHGRGAVGRFFLGSTTQRILQYATCPVIVIPPKA